MDLKKLVLNIRKDGKLTVDEVLSSLVDAVEECVDEEYIKEIYIELYIKAYGQTMTKEAADEWVKSIRVSDGSDRMNGMKWSMDQTTDVGNSVGVDWSRITKIDWYVAMNMEYQKHWSTAKMYGLENDAKFYANIARDEWCDGKKSVFQKYISDII